MNVLILCESKFGNTRKLAEAMQTALAEAHTTMSCTHPEPHWWSSADWILVVRLTGGGQALSGPKILTERLVLTPLGPVDVPRLFEYRSQAEVARYQTWVPLSIDDARHFIADFGPVAFDTPGTWSQLGIRLRDSKLLIGDLGVRCPLDEPRQAEIGVTLAPDHQGRGFGTEAVRGLLGHLFGTLGKHRVFASVDPRNMPSIALLERVGMRQEAHFRESLWFKGDWANDAVFAVLASNWSSR